MPWYFYYISPPWWCDSEALVVTYDWRVYVNCKYVQEVMVFISSSLRADAGAVMNDST